MSFPLTVLLLLATGTAGRSATPGLVHEQPVEGRFVAVDGAFMVPYEEKIPGTDVGIPMVPIPAGELLMGSPAGEADRGEDEGPQVRVRLPAFWMAQWETRWAEYRHYMSLAQVFEKFDDHNLRPVSEDRLVDAVTAPSKLYDTTFTFQSGEEPELPAVTMSQFAAKQYTKWLSLLTERFYRLPTEAEWEYGCRAGTSTAYSFGDDAAEIDQFAWHVGNSEYGTHAVGEKRPNAWGLYDMHGNVEEWVLDGYDAGHYAGLAKKQSISRDAAINWPTKLFPRVLRGGSWDDPADRLRSAARGQSDDDVWRDYDPNSPKSPWWFASDASQDVGFRIIRQLAPPSRNDRNKYWDADIPGIKKVADFRIDEEGRGERGLVDPQLPQAIQNLDR